MSYAGNPNLAPDLQKRILDTFRHTLDVAARGGLEEARLGCDFVLQLDPQFTLAQLLSDKLRGASGPLPVDDLRARLDGAPRPAAASPPRPAAPAAPAAPSRPAAAPARSSTSIPDLRQELTELVAARDFSALTARAQREQAAIASDPGLQQLLGRAQELMEAAPYVDRFLDQARRARAAGRLDEARSLADKARALDPDHPALAQLGMPAAAASPRPPASAAAAAPPPRAADPAAVSGLGSAPPAQELSFGGLQGDDADLGIDLPPLELPEIGEVSDELSLEGLGADAPPALAGAAASDADPRIAELLDEGQAQFARGDLQGAIDAWSRIFLIDIDHEEASRRIDQARNAKAEQERQVEEAYQDALGLVQARDWEGAKTTLRRVLDLQPNHVAARDVLAKVERGELTDLPRPPGASGETALLADITAAGIDEDLKEEILVPPEPGEDRPRAVPGKVKQPPSRRTLLMAVGGVLVVVLGAGWFLMTRWSSLFPNTESPSTAATPAVEQTPITRATELHKEGKAAVAIAQLKRVPPASPYYEEAQALIGQWQQEEAAAGAGAPPAPDQLAKREALLGEARQAEAGRRFLVVQSLLTQAAAIAPLSEEELALEERARQAVEPLEGTLTLLRSEEYDRSLRDLWVVLEKDSGNADARHMLTTAYYNKGILSLQQGKPDEAEDNLEEAAALTPADGDVQRLLHLAQTYQERAPDLLYRIYTKYLTPRPL
jgi:tetratricopeptide (TPR) repeat protein